MGAGLTSQVHVLCRTAEALLRVPSEISSAALADQVIRRYRRLAGDERVAFFRFLADELGPDRPRLAAAASSYAGEPSPTAEAELAGAVRAGRLELFAAINTAAGGTMALVELRSHLLGALPAHPELAPVEEDLFSVLSLWFNRGFLQLHEISWSSPAEVLEKLIEYEAVHEIRDWADLRRRLEKDRRCFGLFHPVMAHEPLIFVEVALTEGLPSSIQVVLEQPAPPEAPAAPDTAAFYSITNCQDGLRGISFGSFLIKGVVEHLRAEMPSLRRFATLSPVPGFGRWLSDRAATSGLLAPADVTALGALADPGWWKEPETAEALRPVLTRACALYLVGVKRGREPDDPVARFHLRNGARLERINWMGDVSEKGLRQSAGVLVNYQYDEADIPANHEAYVSDGRVAHSAEVGRLTVGREQR